MYYSQRNMFRMILQRKYKSPLQVSSRNTFLCTNVKSDSPVDQVGLKGRTDSYIYGSSTSQKDHYSSMKSTKQRWRKRGMKRRIKVVLGKLKREEINMSFWDYFRVLFYHTCEGKRRHSAIATSQELQLYKKFWLGGKEAPNRPPYQVKEIPHLVKERSKWKGLF